MFLIKKNKYKFPPNHIIAFFLFIVIICSVLTVYYDNYRTTESMYIASTEPLGQITKDQKIVQVIHCDEDGLYSIHLYLATYGRTNHCNLHVKLLLENQVIQTWEIEAEKLRDNSYYTLPLDKTIANSSDLTFTLEITSNGTDENAVTIYKNSSGDYSGLYINNEHLEGQSLCYQLEYKTFLGNKESAHIQIFIALCAFLLLFWLVIQFFSISIVKVFLIFWVSLSLAYTCSNPLFNVPDEYMHFYRAYEISLGNFVSDYIEESNSAGTELPLDIDLTSSYSNWQSFSENKGQELSENWTFKSFFNTALYAPISYIPQTVGIYIARHLFNNIAFIAYAGRFINWLAITILSCLAIKLLPYGKEFLTLSLLIPMNIHEAVSLAPDGMVVALSALLVSSVMYLRVVQKSALTISQILLLYALAIAISLYKIVYVPFCLFYLLIPYDRFKYGQKEKIIHAIFVVLLVGMLNLGWLKIASNFLLQPGTNGSIQTKYILAHPYRYYLTLIRTVMNGALTLILGMIGDYLAWLNVPTIGLFTLIYIIYLARKSNLSASIRFDGQKSVKLVSGIVLLSTITLIYTSLYVQWTPVYQSTIDGLQGRYFIALLLPLYLFLTKDSILNLRKETFSFTSQWMVLLINLCACGSLLFSCLK